MLENIFTKIILKQFSPLLCNPLILSPVQDMLPIQQLLRRRKCN